mgnify:CR=1 FL=1
MGVWRKSIGGGSYPLSVQYKIGETVVEGQVMMRDDDANFGGPGDVEITDSATAALNNLGCAMESATYTTTQAADMTEGLVRLVQDPMAIWEFAVSGGATGGTVLVVATTTPSNIFVNDTISTSGLTLTETATGAVDRRGALLKGRTGANAGVTRKITGHTDSTSNTVIVPYPNDIAVGDSFLCVGYSRQLIALTLNTTAGTPAAAYPTMAEANGTTGTDNAGIPVTIVAVLIDELRDTAVVQVCMRTHWFNSLA